MGEDRKAELLTAAEACKAMLRPLEKNQVEWTNKGEDRKAEFLTAAEACKAMLQPLEKNQVE